MLVWIWIKLIRNGKAWSMHPSITLNFYIQNMLHTLMAFYPCLDPPRLEENKFQNFTLCFTPNSYICEWSYKQIYTLIPSHPYTYPFPKLLQIWLEWQLRGIKMYLHLLGFSLLHQIPSLFFKMFTSTITPLFEIPLKPPIWAVYILCTVNIFVQIWMKLTRNIKAWSMHPSLTPNCYIPYLLHS